MKLEEFQSDVKMEMEQTHTIFKTMSTNSWIDQAKNSPIPKMLFGELWFEKEFCILFCVNIIVFTAMLYSPNICRQSLSIKAVFPEPTGPAIPIFI